MQRSFSLRVWNCTPHTSSMSLTGCGRPSPISATSKNLCRRRCIPDYAYETFFSRRSMLTQEYMGLGSEGKDNVIFPWSKPCGEGNTGPNSIDHRYTAEDIPMGCKIYHNLGKKFGVPTPIIDSMIVLSGAMHETSFFEDNSFDLNYLSIGQLDKEQLLCYLHTGQLPD